MLKRECRTEQEIKVAEPAVRVRDSGEILIIYGQESKPQSGLEQSTSSIVGICVAPAAMMGIEVSH